MKSPTIHYEPAQRVKGKIQRCQEEQKTLLNINKLVSVIRYLHVVNRL